ILNANANPGPDTITFNIPGTGVHTISLLTALPAVGDPVVLDGTTEPGHARSPLIELDGSGAGIGANGLDITAGQSTVRGLGINRFARSGILLETNGNDVIEGNYIGTNPTGTTALPNQVGVVIQGGAGNNTIGGTATGARNLISGNLQDGIAI